MKTLLSTAALAIFLSLALVACGGGSKKATFETMPSVSFPGVVGKVVPTATMPAVLPSPVSLTSVSSQSDPCPRTGDLKSEVVVLVRGVGFSISCASPPGLIIAGIQKADDLDDYRRIKSEVDRILCGMWDQEFIDTRVSWAPPTPGDIVFTPADVHTVCAEVGGK